MVPKICAQSNPRLLPLCSWCCIITANSGQSLYKSQGPGRRTIKRHRWCNWIFTLVIFICSWEKMHTYSQTFRSKPQYYISSFKCCRIYTNKHTGTCARNIKNIICFFIAISMWCWPAPSLTHLAPDNMAAISQTIFPYVFSWMKSFVFWLKCHWSLFLRVKFTITQHWFRWWLGAEYATSHYKNKCWPDSLTRISGTRGKWVK